MCEEAIVTIDSNYFAFLTCTVSYVTLYMAI